MARRPAIRETKAGPARVHWRLSCACGTGKPRGGAHPPAAAAPEAAAAVAPVTIRLPGPADVWTAGRRDGGGSHSAPLRATRSGDPVPAFLRGERQRERGDTGAGGAGADGVKTPCRGAGGRTGWTTTDVTPTARLARPFAAASCCPLAATSR